MQYLVEPLDSSPADGANLALQLACMPWPNKQLLLADDAYRGMDPGQLNEVVREKVTAILRYLAGERLPGVPAYLVGHFSVDMASAGGQNRLMGLGGEWTINVHDLAGLEFDSVLLGHIHRSQTLSEQPHTPWMGYSGSPEAVTFGEEGEQKGYWLHTLGDDEAREFVPTPHRKFLTIDADEAMRGDAAPPYLAGTILRVRIGPGESVDLVELRRRLDTVCVSEFAIETERAEAVRRRADITEQTGVEEALRAWLATRPDLEPLADALVAEAVLIEEQIREGTQA